MFNGVSDISDVSDDSDVSDVSGITLYPNNQLKWGVDE